MMNNTPKLSIPPFDLSRLGISQSSSSSAHVEETKRKKEKIQRNTPPNLLGNIKEKTLPSAMDKQPMMNNSPKLSIPPFDLSRLGINQSSSSSAHVEEEQYITFIPIYPAVPEFRSTQGWQRSVLSWGDRDAQNQSSNSTSPVLKLRKKLLPPTEVRPWEDPDEKQYMHFVPILPGQLAPATWQCYEWYHIYQEKTSLIVQEKFHELLLKEFVSNKISLERPLKGPWGSSAPSWS